MMLTVDGRSKSMKLLVWEDGGCGTGEVDDGSEME